MILRVKHVDCDFARLFNNLMQPNLFLNPLPIKK